MLDIKKLRMLAELERLGTIAAVSRELGQTAPGVSMQLAALEREVGLQLTERTGRNVALTPAGRLLAKHGHDIVDMLSLAEGAALALRDGAAGTYRIAAFPSIAGTVVAGAWRSIVDEAQGGIDVQGGIDGHNGIRLELVELLPADALRSLAAGEVQIAITHSYSNLTEDAPDDAEVTPIGSEAVLVALRSDDPILRVTPDGPIALETLSTHDWVIPCRERASGEMAHRACSLAGFNPRVVAQVNDFGALLTLVAAGAGIALVPQLSARVLPAGVVLRPLASPVCRHDFVVMRHATVADPGARHVRDALVASAARFLAPETVDAVPA